MLCVAVCPSMASDDYSDTGSIIAESDIYEDPATTHEGVIPNIDPITMINYLVRSTLPCHL